jgi:hypothetical protein
VAGPCCDRLLLLFKASLTRCWITHSFFKAIRTVERGVPILSRKRFVVTALVCHPAMMDIDATGNDVAFAGHSDGSIASFKVMNGEMLKDFKAPAVEVIDTKGYVGVCV